MRGLSIKSIFGLVVFFGLPGYLVCSQAQFGPTILKAGKWLGNQVLSYLTGKAIDKVVGSSYENELAAVQAGIEAQLRKGSSDAQKLRVELDATKSQLAMLRMLMTSRPSERDLEQFRLKLASDLEKVQQVQRENAARIEQHDVRINQLDAKK